MNSLPAYAHRSRNDELCPSLTPRAAWKHLLFHIFSINFAPPPRRRLLNGAVDGGDAGGQRRIPVHPLPARCRPHAVLDPHRVRQQRVDNLDVCLSPRLVQHRRARRHSGADTRAHILLRKEKTQSTQCMCCLHWFFLESTLVRCSVHRFDGLQSARRAPGRAA